MMVKVRNMNTHPYREKFREKMIEIPPGGSIEMDKDEAHLFLGTYAPMKFDGNGNDMPEGYKMLKIEGDGESFETVNLVCQACGFKASNDKQLSAHAQTEHAEIALVDEAAEAELKTRKKKA